MFKKIISKFFNIHDIVHIKCSPSVNRLLFRCKDITVGHNMCILGKVNVINHGKITIGDNFVMTNGHAINPISSNLQGTFYTELGGNQSWRQCWHEFHADVDTKHVDCWQQCKHWRMCLNHRHRLPSGGL